MQSVQWLWEAIQIYFLTWLFFTVTCYALMCMFHVTVCFLNLLTTFDGMIKKCSRPLKGIIKEENAVQCSTLVIAYFRSGRVKRKLLSFLTAIQKITARFLII